MAQAFAVIWNCLFHLFITRKIISFFLGPNFRTFSPQFRRGAKHLVRTWFVLPKKALVVEFSNETLSTVARGVGKQTQDL
jgi:hypothetical protein